MGVQRVAGIWKGGQVMKRVFVWLRRLFSRFARVEVACVEVEHIRRGEYMATVTWSDGRETRYRGSCTVWRAFPSGRRAGTMLEDKLAEAWAAYEWEQDERI